MEVIDCFRRIGDYPTDNKEGISIPFREGEASYTRRKSEIQRSDF
jgi:hypothetical protein